MRVPGPFGCRCPSSPSWCVSTPRSSNRTGRFAASGKLYRTGSRCILTGKREIEPVWTDAVQPITHFLTDANADRTFLFTKPAKEGEPGVFFELGPKPEPKPYDLSKVKPSKADEPLKGVLERARFLAAQKLLKHPDPPKDEKKP